MLAELRPCRGFPFAAHSIPITGKRYVAVRQTTGMPMKGDVLLFRSVDNFLTLEFGLIDDEWRIRYLTNNIDEVKLYMGHKRLNRLQWTLIPSGCTLSFVFNYTTILTYQFIRYDVVLPPVGMEHHYGKVTRNPKINTSSLMTRSDIRNAKMFAYIPACITSRMTNMLPDLFVPKRISDGFIMMIVELPCWHISKFLMEFNMLAKAFLRCLNLRNEMILASVDCYQELLIYNPGVYSDRDAEVPPEKVSLLRCPRLTQAKLQITDVFMAHCRCVICAKYYIKARTMSCGHVSCSDCYKKLDNPKPTKIMCPCSCNNVKFWDNASDEYKSEVTKRMICRIYGELRQSFY